MSRKKYEKDFRAFYEWWKRVVFTFHLLHLGDESRAEDATQEAFLAYWRRSLPLDRRGLPSQLLQCAVDAAKHRCLRRRRQTAHDTNLETTLLFIPCDQRCVFILRSVLNLDKETIAIATRTSGDEVQALWIGALMAIRSLRPKGIRKELV